MKKVIGVLIILLVVALAVIIGFRIWNVSLVSLPNVLRSGATLIVLGILIAVLIAIYAGVFKDPSAGYNKASGNRAHPKL